LDIVSLRIFRLSISLLNESIFVVLLSEDVNKGIGGKNPGGISMV
jgi:hypothetical protein